MMAHLTAQQRQVIAVGLLIILILLVYIFLLQPFFNSFQQYGDRIDSLEQQIQTYERLARGADQAEAELKALQQDRSDSEYYLPESKPSLAAASLQQLLSRSIRESGGQVISTNIISKSSDSELQEVAIQLHLKLKISELVPLLHSLESGKPLLFIESFSVTSDLRQTRQVIRQQRNQSRATQRAIPSNQVDVRFHLIGYALQEAEL